MSQQRLRTLVNKFNRGEVDPNALSREDVEKISNSGELVENFMPERLGPMMYRPGTEKLATVPGDSYLARFFRSMEELAILEFTDQQLRVWVDDSPIARPAVSSTVTNGTFLTDITGWTDDSGAGSSSAWDSGQYLKLTGSGSTAGASYQEITNSNPGIEHGLRIVIVDAPVTLRLGTTAGATDIFEGVLQPGTHSLSLTPAGNFFVYFENSEQYAALIDSVEIEGAAIMTLPCEVAEADLGKIRYTQSADVVYFCCDGYPQFQVERRGQRSWSLVEFRADDGPFDIINNTDITLTPGALNGDTTLTASRSYFTSSMVGKLFKIESSGQTVQASVGAADNGTGNIRVTGTGNARQLLITRSGTWSGTVTLQRSADEATWEDVTTYTSNGTTNYTDGLNNSDLFYRLWVKSGDYTSGTIELTMAYPNGSISGICRVTQYNSATSVDVQVLSSMGATDATRNWYPGSWSASAGYPSAPRLFEGRLWFAGQNKIWGSVSDAYSSFDRDLEGDDKSIVRTIGFGPVDSVLWLAESSRLIMGLASGEIGVRSSSFGEILTQDNVNLKPGSTQGAASIEPVEMSGGVVFAQRSKKRLVSLNYSPESDSHQDSDLTLLAKDICIGNIKSIDFTMHPEPRIYVVLEDGDARVYLMDRAEDVAGWSRITTPNGNFEEVVVLPDVTEDRVYFVVNRNGTRYMEKLALFSEAAGGDTSKTFDSFVTYTSPGTTLTGLSHLEGLEVGVWADGQYREAVTVSSGSATVSGSWTNVVAGLRYTAKWKSSKVSRFIDGPTLTMRKRVVKTALEMANYWPGAVEVGPDFDSLRPLDGIANQPTDATITDYSEVPFGFNGNNDPDARVCIQADNPCLIKAVVYEIKDPFSDQG